MSTPVPSLEIQLSGGRAGVSGLKWLKAGLRSEQIESLRQQLLAQKDIGRVQRAMRQAGITVKRHVIQAVKQYNFDSTGIAFTEENYSAWRRLATGAGTIGDVAYIVHEIAEIEELQRIKAQTGFDFMGKKLDKLTRKQRKPWKFYFMRYYLSAHSKALEQEYDFLAEQINLYIADEKLKISRLQAAAIDPTRFISGTNETQAARYMIVDGVMMRKHHHYNVWRRRVNDSIRLSSSAQRQLGYFRAEITLEVLISFVKIIRIT